MKRRNFLRSTHKKQYERKRFMNPLVTRVKKRPWRFLIGIVVFLLAVASIPFVLGFAPVFAIDDIHINGLASIPESEIREHVEREMDEKTFFVLPHNSSFYFDEEALRNNLESSYDFVRLDITVDRSSVSIEAEERIVEVVWITGKEYYFIDLQGTIATELTPEEKLQVEARINDLPEPIFEQPVRKIQDSMPVIFDTDARGVTLDEQKLIDEHVETLIEIDQLIRTTFLQPHYYEFNDNARRSLRLRTRNQLDVLVSLDGDPKEQADNLNIILNDYKDRLAELSYIDLRFGNHIYFK